MVLCFASTQADNQNVLDLLQAGVSFHHATLPLYSGAPLKLYAIVRVDRAYTDYERKGFFRIGLLPVGVLDGVTYKVSDPTVEGGGVAPLCQWLNSSSARHVEMRRFTLVLSPTNRLEAGVLRWLPNGSCELRDNVLFASNGRELRVSRATLTVAGQHAGELTLQTTPPTTIALATNQH